MTPEQVQALAHKANVHACQACMSIEGWQQARDQKFAELVEAETLRRAVGPDLTQLTERGATAWAGVDPQALREGRVPLTDQDEALIRQTLEFADLVHKGLLQGRVRAQPILVIDDDAPDVVMKSLHDEAAATIAALRARLGEKEGNHV